MKKVILFDFDNTLVESLADWKQMIDHDTARHYGVAENPEFEPNRHGYSNKDTAKLFLKMHPTVEATYEQVVDYWYDYMEEKYRNNITYFDGAVEFLKALKDKGYKLVLATATGRKLLNKAFDIYDIKKYFDLVICEEDVGKSKMEPDIYIKIMEHFNIEAKDCLYFEDSSIAIKTASNLGIDCVALISKLNEKKIDKYNTMCIATTKNYSQELIDKLSL